MDAKKITLPIAIVFAAIILAIGFYAVQNSKQQSIERQQALEMEEDKAQQKLENEIVELKLKQDECKSLSPGVIKRWNNVMGVTYDKFWGECVAMYTDTKTGEVKTSPLSFMQDNK